MDVPEGPSRSTAVTRRHDVWRQEYREHPYLQHLSDADLNRRHDDLVANFVDLTADGLIGARPPTESEGDWVRLYTHILEEMMRRGVSARAVGSSHSHIPPGADPVAAQSIQGKKPEEGPCLVKYGRAPHLRRLRDIGEIRLAPASEFEDTRLPPAQRDSERRVSSVALPQDIELTVTDGRTIRPVGNVTTTWMSRTDYYLYSLTRTLKARLFRQFGYDACLLISDPEGFLRQVVENLQQELPGWRVFGGAVTYIDPMNPPQGEPNVFLAKHFRYAYQQEFRVLAIPATDHRSLAPRFLALGPMHRYTDHLIELPSTWSAAP